MLSDIGVRLPNAKFLHQYTGSNVLLVDYRGYGNSEGEPSEPGLVMDAQSVLDWLRARPDLDPTKIFIFGSSLGGAVAISLAYNNPGKISGLIVENTFAGISEMALVLFAERVKSSTIQLMLRTFLYFYLTNHWPSAKRISEINVPILFFSGLKDELVPPAHMRRLYDQATSAPQRVFHEVTSGMHNDTFLEGGHAYYEACSKFISDQMP